MNRKRIGQWTKAILPALAFAFSSLTQASVWVPIYNNGITIFIPYEPVSGSVEIKYEYDALGRLIRVNNGTTKSEYDYDEADNRKQKSVEQLP